MHRKFLRVNRKIVYATSIAQCLPHSKWSVNGGSFLIVPLQWECCVLECVLQVEWSDSQNRNVDLHIGTERARGVCRSRASPGERRQHWGHLSAQTGTRFVFVSWFPCPPRNTQSLEFLHYLTLGSLICFPSFSSSPFTPHSHSWHPFPHHSLMAPSPPQGHSRRVQVTVKPVQHSGTLPLMVEAILSVSIGCVTARSTKLQRGLDSYQVRPTGLKQYLTKID